MMKKIITAFFIFCGANAFAQNYDAARIPDVLKKNADAVKRDEELYVIIKSPSKAVIKHHYAITILNEAGADFAQYENNYDKLRSIESISGKLYDASGKELRSVKKKDIGDFSANDESSLMTDNRIRRHNFYYSQYPYTVEYEDEQKMDGIFFLPSWHPIENVRMAVEKSTYSVETPSDFALRYKEIALGNGVKQETKGDKKIYHWEASGLQAVIREAYQPSWSEINPAVYIAPSAFEIEDHKGNMSDWKDLGLFIRSLNSDRQELPDAVKRDVHSLTDKVSSPAEKANILYNYLQQNTRYISVQMGIGSWQPFNATYVAAKKYGDCKALSNYMVSLLKEAGVTANYVLITAGPHRKGLWEDFPSPYFNHAIVCVPSQKDTLWLECTSQTVSAGYMGSFTGNRKALMIADDGGHVVNTPAERGGDNLQSRNIIASVDAQGTLKAKVFTHYTGVQQEDVHELLHGATPEQKEKYLNSILSLPTYSVEKYEYKEKKGRVPEMDEYLSVTAPSYATITGKRLFITPNLFNRSSTRFTEEKERKYDIEFADPFIDTDTVQIEVPAEYSVEAMPKPVSLKTAYGSYSISFEMKENKILMQRRNEMYEGRYPSTEYAAVVAYFNDMYKADRSRIVLVKK